MVSKCIWWNKNILVFLQLGCYLPIFIAYAIQGICINKSVRGSRIYLLVMCVFSYISAYDSQSDFYNKISYIYSNLLCANMMFVYDFFEATTAVQNIVTDFYIGEHRIKS